MKKKSQVTIFVIIGLFILILVGLALFLRTYLTKEEPKPIAVDKELQPLKQGIEECLYLSGKEGIIQTGLQGGYINPRDFNMNPNPIAPTNANSFLFTTEISSENWQDSIVIPYWAYMSADDSCTSSCSFSSQRPFLYESDGSIISIESQLNKYIEENSKTCIQNVIDEFTEKGYTITPEKELAATTTIADTDVLINLDYPLKIKLNEKSYSLSKYETELGINFKKIYDTATRIVQVISNPEHPYLERLTIESIAPYALSSNSDLPPIVQVVESFNNNGKTLWVKNTVKDRVTELVGENVGNVQVQGTLNNLMPLVMFDDIKQAYYDNYYFSLDSLDQNYDVSNYMISFNYVPDWNMYFNIRPSKGGIIRPEKTQTSFPFPISLTKYAFYYDISYPALIQIIDPDAFYGEGYTFQFGYEVNVRNTQAISGDFTLIDIPPAKTGLLCEDNQKKSGNIEVTAVDKLTQQPISGALISYSCTGISCELGETSADGKFSTKLPICIDGMVTPELTDYFGLSKTFSTAKDEDGTIKVELEKYVEMPVSINKMLVGIKPVLLPDGTSIPQWSLLPERIKELEVDEWGILTLTRIPEAGEQEFIQVLDFKFGEEDKTIQLLTGSYTVEITLFKSLGPDKSKEKVVFKGFCEDSLFTDKVCVDDLVFNSTFVLGSINIDETYPFKITADDLAKSKLDFYVPSIDLDEINSLKTDTNSLEISQVTVNAETSPEILPSFS